MAEFPPAQYIDGYTATGDTISFTIAGYTGKKVASVSVSDGGSYTTPTASVAFSGGSGSGAMATASMTLKSATLTSTGASSLIQTSNPANVALTLTGGAIPSPIFGLASVSPNADLFFDAGTTPTVTVSGENETYTDASVLIDQTSGLLVASLVTPHTLNQNGDFVGGNAGSGSYKISDESSVQIVDASNTNTVLGTATITANNQGRISSETVILDSWNTVQSKSTLNGYSLKLKSTEASFEFTSFTPETTLYLKTKGSDSATPSFAILETSAYGVPATFNVNTTTCTPASFFVSDSYQPYTATANVTIIKENNQQVVGTMSAGSSQVTWTGGPMTWESATQFITYLAVTDVSNPDVYVERLVISGVTGSVTWNGAGRYDTEALSFTIINIYNDNSCTIPATSSNFNYILEPSTTAQLSTSAFAIKAFKMPLSTASSRISVTNSGNGYTDKLELSCTGLKLEAELINNADNTTFNQIMLLKKAKIESNNSIYTTTPTMTISGGGISDTNVVKTFEYNVNSITITNGGLGYATTPTVTISGSVQSGGANATGTAVLSTSPAISLPNLAENEADPITGDFREICYSICELVNNIDTQSVRTGVQTTLQTGGVGIIDKFTFVFDLVPETGVLVVEEES